MPDKHDKPYPISTKLTFGTEVVPAQILKLTPTGFLADLSKPELKTGEKFQAVFELPRFKKTISEICVIVKLYKSSGSLVIEGHFQSPSLDTESNIMKFVSSVKGS